MAPSRWDAVIVGGGILGLSSAMALSKRNPDLRLLVLEKEAEPGRHQSGRNSGVIHAGLYYRPGSLKARMCVEGARAMVEFAIEHGIPHELCGKLVVATSEAELPRLEELHRRGTANGAQGLELVGPERLREIEPHAAGIRALWSPGTGIIDYPAVVRAYARIVKSRGNEIRTGAEVRGIRRLGGETVVETTDGEFACGFLVNCAGLHADRVARLAGGQVGLQIVPFRGEYYEIVPERRSLVRGLIYPVPDPAFPFLGVHFTRRVGGAVEAGPNAVLAFMREGYTKMKIDPRDLFETLSYPGFRRLARKWWRVGAREMARSFSKAVFTRDLQKLVPEIEERDLAPGGAGVRAQAVDREGNLLDDFAIVRTEGAIHVCNAPSPGATASLLIGRAIAEMAGEACPALAPR
ncbi:MAG: L-2-hydroxyglutarate oxidase [Candidatus Tectomicrobia bacterium]|uniref:L-2-hydroxyglutarate oxidase n=1 Tax=Tectimicrobiota bacterium TaxID=2528274 RepID=A0A932HZQ9_UNCTE|nr:L-2-hydroxyglutarate oxidase [Candidatus Tectomicrobia bacterium]